MARQAGNILFFNFSYESEDHPPSIFSELQELQDKKCSSEACLSGMSGWRCERRLRAFTVRELIEFHGEEQKLRSCQVSDTPLRLHYRCCKTNLIYPGIDILLFPPLSAKIQTFKTLHFWKRNNTEISSYASFFLGVFILLSNYYEVNLRNH